ncbi:iron-containing alcohol dehydrogenase [Sulfitobacter sp. JB4-11]|uniref:iron-containing alcohol dehydrogenase n=1 Tax=Sulfitobacter rhodophyticola TaxID=3238304 RepID=UPI003518B5B6
MTLIDYLNRVHFADNIIEEAVWAELDRRLDGKLCVLSTTDQFEGELGERVRAGLPRQSRTANCPIKDGVPTEEEALRVAAFYTDNNCTAVLAFGRGYVINLAKAVRLLVSQKAPLAQYSETEGGSVRVTSPLPDLIAVPRLQGFIAGFNGLVSILLEDGTMIDIGSRNLVPTVTIGDPTLAVQEPTSVQASASVEAITLCTEALLSPKYNPPANGIALDGLRRGLQSLSSISDRPDIRARRELMAACMNAAMVQQKGLGLTHAVTSSLCAITSGTLDKGAIKRLVLPEILAFFADNGALAHSALMGALGFTNPADTVKTMRRALRDLPLAASLSKMGITAEELQRCSTRAAHHRAQVNAPCQASAADLLKLLHAIY